MSFSASEKIDYFGSVLKIAGKYVAIITKILFLDYRNIPDL